MGRDELGFPPQGVPASIRVRNAPGDGAPFPMKIIYLHQHFGTPRLSHGTYSYEWARRLVASGHEVHMLAGDRSGQAPGWYETEEAAIHVHWYPVAYSNQMSYKRRIGAFMRFAWVAARRAVGLPGDLVYATSTPLTVALPGVYVARKKSIPMVFEVADLWPEMPIAVGALKNPLTIAAARWMERFAYRNSAHIFAQSPGMKEGIVGAGYPQDRVTVIPACCDAAEFQVPARRGHQFRSRYPWLGDRPLVVYGGSLNYLNDVGYLARVAAEVRRRDPEIRFLIIGRGVEEEQIRRTARRLGVLDETFFMHPPIPRAQMPAVLSAADIATSVFRDIKQMWANAANKLFDALAAGRPIAINHQGWIAQMIRQTGCGLVLDVHDVRSAADALVAALRDRPWLTRAGAAARRVAEERFNRDKLSALRESILVDIVSNRRRRLAA